MWERRKHQKTNIVHKCIKFYLTTSTNANTKISLKNLTQAKISIHLSFISFVHGYFAVICVQDKANTQTPLFPLYLGKTCLSVHTWNLHTHFGLTAPFAGQIQHVATYIQTKIMPFPSTFKTLLFLKYMAGWQPLCNQTQWSPFRYHCTEYMTLRILFKKIKNYFVTTHMSEMRQ